MAELPDIDTSNVSFLAYWNALDHGVSAIDPEEITSLGRISEYTFYDNGIEGRLSPPRGAYFRVKSDGWVVVWMDRSASSTTMTNDRSAVSGPWDMMMPFSQFGSVTPREDGIFDAVQSIQSQFSNSDEITFNFADVGLYNYEHTDATTLSVFGSSHSDNNANVSGSLSYTDTTTRHWHYVTGHASDTYADSSSYADWNYDGGSILLAEEPFSGDAFRYGARDVLANGDMPASGVESTLSYGSDSGDLKILSLSLWS